MSKLRIEHGVSRTKRAKLQVSVDHAVATDVELMATWSNNEAPYIVNELLRFAIAQSEEFQRYKAEITNNPPSIAAAVKPTSPIVKPSPSSETKPDASTTNTQARG